ncbi:MAG: hypothetical protein IRZ29_01225 [Thermoflavifilum sp.]|nr:hypothetical protein [Thermoflavifilum sp.]
MRHGISKKWLSIGLFMGCLGIASLAYAHGEITDSVSTTISSAYPATHNTGTWADFPKLHPMIVHFPIVLLILAAVVQFISFFVFHRELSWVSMCLLVLGFIAAYLASGIFHGGDPDPSMLDPVSRATFEKHALYANYTLWISGIASVVKCISHFIGKRKRWTEIIALIFMIASVYTVAVAADMGARLVHIDAIGVQGRMLPAEDSM